MKWKVGDKVLFKSGKRVFEVEVVGVEEFFGEYILKLPDGTKRQISEEQVKVWNS